MTLAARAPNLLLPCVGLALLAGFAALAAADHAAFVAVLGLWSFHPESAPFFDLDGPLAWVRAWRAGGDVYRQVTEGAHAWRMNYSPLLLRWPLPWVSQGDVPVYGLAVDALFLAALAALPRARAVGDAALMLLALVSPLCLFGLERGNLDVLMFALVAVALAGWQGGIARRVLGDAAVTAAGLIKFYPLVVLLLLVRRRPAEFFAVALAVAAILTGFVLAYHDELALVGANLPVVIPFGDTFGAAQAATGIVFLTHTLHAAPGAWDSSDAIVWLFALVGLHAVAIVTGLRLGRGAALRDALARLTVRENLCLAAGAILMAGCFFAGSNVGYRAVHLLFALPGLLALARVAEPKLARRTSWTIAAAFAVLWSLPAQRLVTAAFGPFWDLGVGLILHPLSAVVAGGLFWLLREAAWWWLMVFLLGIVVRAVLDSRIWTAAARRGAQA